MSEQRLFACERCSRRKQRCDRTVPVCQPCQEAQAECIGSASEGTIISGNNRVAARKGPVTRLLEQIDILEEKLRGHDRGETSNDNASAAVEPERASSDAAAEPSEHQGSAALPQSTSMNMRFLSLSAMTEPSSRRGEFLKHLSTQRLIVGITKTYGGDPESTARPDSLWEGISAYLHHPQGSKHRLRIPPADANKALEIYLAVVDFRFPRLPVDKVLLGIDAISHVEEDHFRRVVATDPAHVFMAYAVITIVPLVSDAYPISQGSWVSVHLLGKCMELLDRVFNQEDGIDIIQCLQLLVILAVHCSAAGSAWHLSSFAMNKCIALGYHREDPKSASMSLLDVQQRRWAFWGCYFLDVLICAALGRPPSIDVKHITTPLPADPASNSSSQCAQHGQIISNLRTSPSTTHRLVSRDVYHKQLFQYARLLSQVVSEATNSPQSSGSCDDFEHHLGQALSWRISSLPHDEPDSCNIYLFQTSLYNTLMLRLAVRELLILFSFGPDLHDSETTSEPITMFLGDINTEESRMKRLKISQICAAVARSLDRVHMTGRSYLSLITGYSSLTMAFTCLYFMAVRTIVRHATAENTTWDVPQSHLGSNGSSMTWHPPPSSFPFQNSGDTVPSFVPSSSRSYHQSPESQAWADSFEVDGINDAFNIAIAKVDVVGRQFPRLNHYGRMALDIRKLLISMSSPVAFLSPTEAVGDQLGTVKASAQDIGPMYLRQLTAAILCIISQAQPN
ncbi:hypothetical protein BFJ66_g16743 [Fusarium oxysporum f. sp. cepae]|uniref:Zn(2)-C6 fungal-type domain-containing protein n=2 Tax=Fusarium oxysporum f. sp. cepae TaxID=396571 RepID=A0A3L6NTS8_FUSOX|nr:hypothetical protein BFJ65_g5048 [Fusarium oxysporum f. sp. cepae]RKK27252.1 hypothetical protein BFJ66_g16743 [Fusarium oxysporum f. sp. cepae]RKK35797.1 hypothetical protein BFJ67_g13131 [Fusarium oxysporum f. sp. cepae]